MVLCPMPTPRTTSYACLGHNRTGRGTETPLRAWKEEHRDGQVHEPRGAGRQGVPARQAPGLLQAVSGPWQGALPERGALLAFDAARRAVGADNRLYLGRRVVEVSKIVGSVGRHRHFDSGFMPTKASMAERWKRVDRAFHRGVELPPVRLYKLGDAYFVEDAATTGSLWPATRGWSG